MVGGSIKIDKLKEVILKNGYRFYENGAFNLNIIGIRSKQSKSNKFDDLLFVCFKDNSGAWVLKFYPVTTDPGKHWLLYPMIRQGAAILVPGQYPGCYTLGIHGRTHAAGGYPALEQIRPMNYVRDNSRDEIVNAELYNDSKNIFSSNLKTNIHRGNQLWLSKLNKTYFVDRYSAGCQVFQYADHFNEFMTFCLLSKAYWGNSFTYTLLEEIDFS